ncbi:uncharacterized protein BO80DRAFT_500379 [Aspergillus ibericus CBS 121593]|uniref:Uncharacterized protein n=1 Tax=Aspergillus ibericus CBS 121593 TaxID=1448316 RepID=A0A395H9N0_9EURO|nr:hypothetical protein BO80DRAFT_500379 [Aspergillus ibericus CBS 121593]RAL03598.1 hypothetical protein BO80DRAFT_500379 [Aspergillus ibericus CBS 121593]
MSTISPPPVTLEDLQTFQAKHFPGSAYPTQPLTDTLEHPNQQQPQHHQQHQQEEEYYHYEEEAEEDDDDGLGYYPDGIKRTLTDEQIRIFRHSEIHALLREKELREEEEAEMRAEAEAEAERERKRLRVAGDVNPAAAADADADAEGVESVTLLTATVMVAPSSAAQEAQHPPQTRVEEDTPMDYGDGDSVPSRSYGDTSGSSSSSRRAPQFPGRRIISYDD